MESAYFAIKQSMLGRRVLRARTLPGIAQEIYALLTTYQVIRTAIADTTIDLVGTIGRAVLTHLMPARRLRLSPRAVKRPISRYAYKSLCVDRRTYKATISIDILLTEPISP